MSRCSSLLCILLLTGFGVCNSSIIWAQVSSFSACCSAVPKDHGAAQNRQTMSNTQFAFPPLPELRTAKVFGQIIRYYDVGLGPALVLVHGIGGDADDWAFCLIALASLHRVIALDMLGFGRSNKPYLDYSIAVFLEMLERFLTTLKIGRATLVGHSLGGWIAASFALRSPEVVDKLVLIDSAGVWGEMRELPVDLHVSTLAHMREIFQHLFYDKTLISDALVEFAYTNHLERGDGYTIHSVLENLRGGREWLDGCIGELRVPTLIIWGANDEIIPLELGRRIHELVPGSSLEIIPKCGHLPELEKPAELVKSILRFLER